MADEQQWLHCLHAINQHVANLARKGLQLSEEGDKKAAKALQAKAKEWDALGKRMLELIKSDGP